jgi:hypothetical protein
MTEAQLGGLVCLFAALPGLGLGIAMLVGKFRPASLATARDPDHARVAVGAFMAVLNGLIAGLGVVLLAVDAVVVRPLVPYAVGVLVAVSILGLPFVFRAARGPA